MADDVSKVTKRLFKATLVFERFSDYKTFLNSVGVSSRHDMEDVTILMPQVNDEGQSRLDVINDA